MEESRSQGSRVAPRKGARIGAIVGAVLFAGPGLWASLLLSNYVMVAYLGSLDGEPLGSGIVFRLSLVIGIISGMALLGTLVILGSSALGALTAYVALQVREPVRQAEGETQAQRPIALHMNMHRRMSARAEDGVRRQLSFLAPVRNDVRSIAVIGSAAHESRVPGSDIDIVLICREAASNHVREFVFGMEIDAAMAAAGGTAELGFTILSEKEATHFFEAGSAFAHAMGQGVWLEDDGFIRNLIASPLPTRPGQDFYLTQFHDHVAVQYLGAIAALKEDIRQRHCSRACCKRRPDCEGLGPADDLCRTIMRMLYLVLPANGYMPLTKNDVADFAGRVYGGGHDGAMKSVLSILRSRHKSLRFTEYIPLKRFAATLFREVLALVDQTGEARPVLEDARSLVQGRYADIQDAAMRNCVS